MAPMPVSMFGDDRRLFCEALLGALRAALNVDAVETAATLEEALERLRRRPAPDLMLFDLVRRNAAWLGSLIELSKAAPGVAIIFVPTPHEDRVAAAILQVGSDHMPKGGPQGLFVKAIDRVWAGDGYAVCLPPRAKGRAELDDCDAVDLMRSLTPQQARILQLVCEGKFNKQIAYNLDISEGTVKAHLTAIMRKLNVQNRIQAVLIAQRAGPRQDRAGLPRRSLGLEQRPRLADQ